MGDYNRAFQLLGQWKADQAIPILKSIVTTDPSFYRAYVGITEAYAQKNDLPAAKQYFDELQETAPSTPPYFVLGQALTLNFQGKCDKCAVLLDRCIEQMPRWSACSTILQSTEGYARRAFIQRFEKLAALDPSNPAASLDIATVFMATNDGSSAAAAFKIAARKAAEQRDLDLEALSTERLSDAYLTANDFRQALEMAERAVRLFTALGDEAGQLHSSMRVFRCLLRSGDQTSAMQRFELYAAKAREIRNSRALAEGYAVMATPLREQGNADLALLYYRSALAIYEASPDIGATAEVLLGMAQAGSRLGLYPEALKCLDRCSELSADSRLRRLVPYISRVKGNLYEQLGDYTKALDCQIQSVRAFQERGQLHTAGAGIGNLGDIYEALGDYSRARESYTESLRSARQFFDLGEQESNLSRLGQLCLRLGSDKKALVYLTQAYNFSRRTHDTRYRALSSISMGLAYDRLGDLNLAIKSLEEALEISQAIKDASLEGGAYNRLGMIHLKGAKVDAAHAEFQNALAIAEPARIRECSRMAHEGLGDVASRAGLLNEAVEQYKKAVEEIESMRSELDSSNSRIGFLSDRTSAYEKLIDALARKGRGRDALFYSERSHAREFRDTLIESRTGMTAHLTPEQMQKRVRLLADISRANASQHRREQIKAEDALEQWLLTLRETNPRYAQIHSPNSLDAAGLQAEVARRGHTVIEYSLGDRRSYVWIVTPEKVEWASLPSRSMIDRQISVFRGALVSPTGDSYGKAARDLYSMLVSPIARYISVGARLTVIPDGSLHYLPFEALMEGAHFWGEFHDMTYAPSASSLAELVVPSLSGKRELLAFGDPTLRLGAASDSAPGIVRGIDEKRGMRFTPLPNTHQEVEGIASLYPTSLRKTYLGSAATKSALKTEALSVYKKLHFATHALVDDENPARSGIVLSPEGAEDGVLRLHEILALDLNADLVVLSACETGLGKLVRGEGLIGMSKAFLYAGASRVVVSLWQVNDVATSALMQSFYRKMNAGALPARALREAKIEMLRSGIPGYQHPYYWAPFVLLGAP